MKKSYLLPLVLIIIISLLSNCARAQGYLVNITATMGSPGDRNNFTYDSSNPFGYDRATNDYIINFNVSSPFFPGYAGHGGMINAGGSLWARFTTNTLSGARQNECSIIQLRMYESGQTFPSGKGVAVQHYYIPKGLFLNDYRTDSPDPKIAAQAGKIQGLDKNNIGEFLRIKKKPHPLDGTLVENGLTALEVKIKGQSDSEYKLLGRKGSTSWRTLRELGYTDAQLANKKLVFRGIACGCHTGSKYNPYPIESLVWPKEDRVYTVEFELDYIQSSPKYISHKTTDAFCSDSSDGTVKLTFSNPIEEDFDMRLVLKSETPGGTIPEDDPIITELDASNSTTFPVGLKAGTYSITYQTIDYSGPGGDVVVKSREDTPSFTIEAPTSVTVAVTTTIQPVCAGETGSITLKASGGAATGSYQYSKDNGVTYGPNNVFSGLNPNSTYRFKVQRTLPNGTICESINTETVVIDDITDPITIDSATIKNHPSYPNATDGAIDIKVRTGLGDYTFQVFEGSTLKKSLISGSKDVTIDGLAEGNYTIKVIDSKSKKCSITYPTILKLKDVAAITFTSIDVKAVDCNDGKTGQLEVKGVTGGNENYIYQWTKDGDASFLKVTALITGLTPGTYRLKIRDTNGNFDTPDSYASGFKILENPIKLEFINVKETNIACIGGKGNIAVTAKGGTTPYSYRLGSGPWVSIANNQYDWNIEVDKATRQPLTIKDVKGCETSYGIVTVDAPTEALEVTKATQSNITIFGDSDGSLSINVYGGYTVTSFTTSWTKNGDPFTPPSGSTKTNLIKLTAGTYQVMVEDAEGCMATLSQPITITQPDRLEVTIEQTQPILCNGGTGTLTALPKGGITTATGAYSYQWYKNSASINGATSAVLNNVSFGNYSVTITDDYTNASSTVLNFLEPPLLQLDLSKTDPKCFEGNDGTIVLDIQGGTAPYFYAINTTDNYNAVSSLSTANTITGLEAGTYAIWLKDANDCEIVSSKDITLNPATEIIIAEATRDDVTVLGINDGKLGVNASGGTGSLSYIWTKQGGATFLETTPQITNLFAGTYVVTVTDANSCLKTREFNIFEPKPMIVEITASNTILCQGGTVDSLTAIVDGGFPLDVKPENFSYQWYTITNGIETPINTDLTLSSLTAITAGTYKVVAEDIKGTTNNQTIVISEPEKLTVSKISQLDVKCHNQATGAITIEVSGGPKDTDTGAYLPYTYSWSRDGDPSFTSTDKDLSGLKEGVYQVIVTDANDCSTSLMEPVHITQPQAPLEITDLEVTPLSGFQTQNGQIVITVIGGTAPYSYLWTKKDDPLFSENTKDLNQLSIGEYTLLVTDTNDCTATITRTVTEPEQLIVTINPLGIDDGIYCFGEKTQVPLTTTSQGGFGVYNYEWYEKSQPDQILYTDPDSALVSAGTYVVIIKDENGNTATDEIIIPQPEVLTIEALSTPASCNGKADGSILLNITGGNGNYSYSWSHGPNTKDVSNLLGGVSYTVTVTDPRGCSEQKTIFVNEPNALFIDGPIERIYPSAPGLTDGQITVNMGGGTPPYSFIWTEKNGSQNTTSTSQTLDAIGAEKYAVAITDANGCIYIIDDVDQFEPPALDVTIEQINVVACNGDTTSGSIKATATGGFPFNATKQYTYAWYDVLTNLQIGTDSSLLDGIGAGNYYVVITDAISTQKTSATFEVKEPEVLNVQLQSDFQNCGTDFDWQIISTVTGGTPPYNYAWNTRSRTPNLRDVQSGTYEVVVTDFRGCIFIATITLTPPAPLESTLEGTNPTCYAGCDGSIVQKVVGGTPPYSYEWNTGATTKDAVRLCSGSYVVTITDSKGCSIAKTTTLQDPEQLTIDLGDDITLCKGQTANINATTPWGANYAWSSSNGFLSNEPFISVKETGIYTVLITDNKGCTATDAIFVEKTSEIISANFVAASQVFTGEPFVIVNISDPAPDTLEWNIPDSATILNTDNNYAELVFDTAGTYEITVATNRGLCTDVLTKKVVVLDAEEFGPDPSGVQNVTTIVIDYRLFPNPSLDGRFTLNINLPEIQDIRVKIFQMGTNRVMNYKDEKGKDAYSINYDMSNAPAGMYFILVETPMGDQVQKLILE